MRVIVIYDSAYGNTEQVARAIGGAFSSQEGAEVFRVGEITPEQVIGADLVIVGSPTQGGRPTPAVLDFLSKVSKATLKGASVAAFDTRISTRLVGIFGYAAGKIANGLKEKGGTLAAPPEGFFVKGSKGPLKEGELERAAAWAKGLIVTSKKEPVRA
ncbi:MAG: flavodoxin family protein [Chloroflexi bacterium]|nr:flavodoxin family protein [Chloroflexota bacterium]